MYEIFLGLDTTKLVFEDWLGDMIYSFNVSKVTVKDLHLTRSSPGTTQGWVRAVSTGQVVLEIPPGSNQGKPFRLLIDSNSLPNTA